MENFDLLIPSVGELAGGSVREEREQELRAQIGGSSYSRLSLSCRLKGVQTADTPSLDWYLDLRRHGTSLHGGFGMGFERLVSWVGGVENVRECLAWPRWTGRLSQ